MELRILGRSDIKVSPLGLGTVRIAGLGWRDNRVPQDPSGGKEEGIRQIREAVDLGVTLFDTADNYGQGLSESILGEALRGRRNGIVIISKFGEDPIPEQQDPWALEASTVRHKCEDSLRRLGVDCIDLYLLHRRDYPLEQAQALMEVLEELVCVGKIRYYGWSTDDVERARVFSSGKNFTAIEHRLNIFNDNPAMLELCREQQLASLNRVPLLMGVLAGCWSPKTKLEHDDPRAQWFEQPEFLQVLTFVQAIEPYLTINGRSHVQGALGWIWARSPLAIPLPGFRDSAQMKALVQAQKFGPLPPHAMQAISEIISVS